MTTALRLTIFLMFLCLSNGCALVDGVKTYHFCGRLVNDQDGKPVAGAKIQGAIVSDQPSSNEVWQNNTSITEASGTFDATAKLLWVWWDWYPMLWIRGPSAGPVEKIAICIEHGGKKEKKIIAISQSQQTKVKDSKRWIELGEIKIDLGIRDIHGK